MIKETGMPERNFKDPGIAQRESAMFMLNRMIETKEKELNQLKAFRQMLPEAIPNDAEHLMWTMLSNLNSNPWA